MDNSRFKFRAWNKRTKKINEDWLLNSCKLNKKGELIFVCPDYSNDKIILMQFTGLKDRNGKEIYEGDICGYGDVDPSIFLVIWQFNGWAKKYPKWDKSLPYHLIDECDLEDIGIEIIGNIYENPGLLKE